MSLATLNNSDAIDGVDDRLSGRMSATLSATLSEMLSAMLSAMLSGIVKLPLSASVYITSVHHVHV